jgi:hypothetical protein
MATGRTHPRFLRVYMDGYDMSGYSRAIGDIGCTFEEGTIDPFGTTVKGVMIGQATPSFGPLNGLFDNTATSGLHVIAKGAGVTRDILVAIGIQAAPANNDPSFAVQMEQTGYSAGGDENPVTVTIPFTSSYLSDNLPYARPFGVLLHANAAATAANTATGLDQTAQTTTGGFMMYQVTAGNGTAAIKVQHASTNVDGSFSDLLSSGTIDCSSPTSGVVDLAKTTTVERYVRWQIALGTATTVTFAISWHRNLN